jgi:hypothetical protein
LRIFTEISCNIENPSKLPQLNHTTLLTMNSKEDIQEARLERLILGAAASCVVAMLYLLVTSLLS